MKVMICAGGTGGHMFPSCALFTAMLEKHHDVTLITDTRGAVFCTNIHPKMIFETIRFSVKKLSSVIVRLLSTFSKLRRLWKYDTPDVVIGFGGLFTIMPLLIAKYYGAKIIIFEQNMVVGKANIFLSRFADWKLSTFDIDPSWTKVTMPVRKEFLKFKHQYACDGKVKILVIGGSQGARSFSKIIPEAISKLNGSEKSNIEIIQQVSHENILDVQKSYEAIGVKAYLSKFIDNVAQIMSDVQLVICRSGASTLSELSEMGCPAILIPFPQATENHQYKNALYYEKLGAAWVLQEAENTADSLASMLRKLINDRSILKNMTDNMKSTKSNQTLDDLVKLIEKIQR